MRVVADGVEVVLEVDEVAVFGLEVEGLGEIGDGELDVAGEAPVAGEVVVNDGLGGVGFEGFFERLNGEIEAAGAFVAPAEGEPDVDVGGFGLGCFAEDGDGLGEGFHGAESLAAEEEDVAFESARALDAVERAEDAAGEHVAGVGPAGHAFAKDGDQVEIAFGFSQDLLATDAIGIGHGPRSPR